MGRVFMLPGFRNVLGSLMPALLADGRLGQRDAPRPDYDWKVGQCLGAISNYLGFVTVLRAARGVVAVSRTTQLLAEQREKAARIRRGLKCEARSRSRSHDSSQVPRTNSIPSARVPPGSRNRVPRARIPRSTPARRDLRPDHEARLKTSA
jgi:hypothetical protein